MDFQVGPGIWARAMHFHVSEDKNTEWAYWNWRRCSSFLGIRTSKWGTEPLQDHFVVYLSIPLSVRFIDLSVCLNPPYNFPLSPDSPDSLVCKVRNKLIVYKPVLFMQRQRNKHFSSQILSANIPPLKTTIERFPASILSGLRSSMMGALKVWSHKHFERFAMRIS